MLWWVPQGEEVFLCDGSGRAPLTYAALHAFVAGPLRGNLGALLGSHHDHVADLEGGGLPVSAPAAASSDADAPPPAAAPSASAPPRVCLCLPAHSAELAVAVLGLSSLQLCAAPVSPSLPLADLEFELHDIPAAALVLADTDERQPQLAAAAERLGLPVLVLTADAAVTGLFSLRRHSSSDAGAVENRASESSVASKVCARDRTMDGALASSTATASSAGNASPTANPSPGPFWSAWWAAVRQLDVTQPPASLAQTALVLHTSGSTRQPKVVPLTHGGLQTGAAMVQATLQLGADDRCFNLMPLFHLHGLAINLLVTAVAGASVYLAPALSRDSLVLMQEVRPTWYSASPTVHQHLLRCAARQAPPAQTQLVPSLAFIRNCSAALPVAVGEQLEAAFGCPVLCTYAMTECLPIASNPRFSVTNGQSVPLVRRSLASVGPPAGPEVRVAAPESVEPLPVGEEGEVLVRGPCVTPGYEMRSHFAEDPNADAFRDGWLRTGDKGWFDADGHLHLAGRFKEVINRGGEKISPLAIEEVALRHPLVQQCAAFAAPHDLLGETVALAVVVEPGEGGSPAALLPALRHFMQADGHLEAKWLPEALVLMPHLPLGRTGKILRIGLAAKLGMAVIGPHGRGAVPVWTAAPTADGCWSLTNVGGGAQGNSYDEAVPDCAAASAGACERETSVPDCGGEGAVAAEIRSAAARMLLLDPSVLGDHRLVDVGLDSLVAVELVDELSVLFGLPLPSSALDTHPTVAALAELVESMRAEEAQHSTAPASAPMDGAAAAAAHSSAHADAGSQLREVGRNGYLVERPATFLVQRENASKPESGLYMAKHGELARLQAHIAKGWDPAVVTDKHGLTALQWAAGKGHMDVTLYLLDDVGVDVNQGSKEGRTPLMWAARNGHVHIAKVLLEHGADLHAITRKGVTALHWAVWGRSIAMIEFLVEHGMDIETRSHAGCNCAIWAAAAGCPVVCDWLLARGADFELLNNWGHGVLVKSAWKGHLEVLRWLFAHVDIRRQLYLLNPAGQSPVELAELAEHGAVRDFLLEQMAVEPQPFAPSMVDLSSVEVHQHKQKHVNLDAFMNDL